MTRTLLTGSPYVAYAYSYPHKTAYRPFAAPRPLADVWRDERRDALFLYMHVPFCEMRCGFCNLFTTLDPHHDLEDAYLDALERQARQTSAALGAATFARLAIGGGTPTFLRPDSLHRLFDIAAQQFGADAHAIPVSVETSPATADDERLAVLRQRGTDRVSIGVQSFVPAEAAAAGRPQRLTEVHAALERIRAHGFPTLNIDLIYGIDGQTVASWLESLRAALAYQPEELYLYPLYVRPLTGLGRRDRAWDDIRLACYRAGRDLLLAAGYEQMSMRMFRAPHAPALTGPVYCCQEDGMLGLGCGARSYTQRTHYSSEYAVGAQGVRAILRNYIGQSDTFFAQAHYGYELTDDDARRRYVIQSLLQAEGMSLDAYRARFSGDVFQHLPHLHALGEHGLTEQRNGVLMLTEAGLERSDAVGPWLYPAPVATLMEAFDLQ